MGLIDRSDPVENALYVREETLLEATEAICEAMQSQGVTQEALAGRLGLTLRQVHNLLDGKQSMMVGQLADVARVLGCRVRIKLELDDAEPQT